MKKVLAATTITKKEFGDFEKKTRGDLLCGG